MNADLLHCDNMQETKKDIAFGRFTAYDRHLHPNDTAAYRLGSGGQEICSGIGGASVHTISCRVRQHFSEWSQRQPKGQGLDVLTGEGMVSMQTLPFYKFLVHLDGQGLSSRWGTRVHT